MSATDLDLFSQMVRVENKDIFVDLKRNKGGDYLKISERNGNARSSVLIPASGIQRLLSALQEASVASSKAEQNADKTGSRVRKNRVVQDPTVASRSVYVTGLAWEATDDELAAHFKSSGEVVKAVILRQRRGGRERSMGCGVVEFSSNEEASKAIDELNETQFMSRTIKCREDRTPVETEESATVDSKIATKKENKGGNRNTEKKSSDEESGDKVFISNLPFKCSESEIKEFLSEAGEVLNVEIIKTRDGRSKGSAVAQFANPSSAQTAIESLSSKELAGRALGLREYVNK